MGEASPAGKNLCGSLSFQVGSDGKVRTNSPREADYFRCGLVFSYQSPMLVLRERRQVVDVSWGWVDGFIALQPASLSSCLQTGRLRLRECSAASYDWPMSDAGLANSLSKMRDHGVAAAALEVFEHYYRQAEQGASGFIREADIEPLLDPPQLAEVEVDEDLARDALARTAIIKLNGGLGTSMGLDKAKTLLPVRDGRTFLDLIVRQVLEARQRYGVRLPLLFMNSFRTRDDTLAHLEGYPDLPVDGLPLDFLQNAEPKLLADTLEPAEWPADPELEWCPPGHGDIYTALSASGVLDALLAAGFRYANLSNGDNLGAAPDAKLAGWFASSGAPYAAELCPRTVNDRKGGHLAIRRSDGQLVLRDTAQTHPDEMHFFTDEFVHPYFHTNNLWLDLEVLAGTLASRGAVLGLPLIKNEKTVDPADPNSPRVIQLETAMGAAIEVFPGASAIAVERDRFLPVKTTNELLLVRSDAFELQSDGRLVATTATPEVVLDKRFYGLMDDFDSRIVQVPSLREAESLRVDGDWSFLHPCRIVGAAHFTDKGESRVAPDGVCTGEV